MGFPPIGMSLSSVLKAAGHDCVMFDQANPDTPNDVIVEEIKRQKPALVGLQLPEYDQLSVCQDSRPADPRRRLTVKLAFGGVFASLNAGLVKPQCPEVDFVCRGDGEQLLLDLLAQMDAPETVGGLTWMKDGHVMTNPGRPMERHLDQWPFPDVKACGLISSSRCRSMSRPCCRWSGLRPCRRHAAAWPCVFCDIPIFNEGKWRARSAAHVVAELKYLEAHGYGAVYFVDDHFLLQPKRIEAICNGVSRNI